MRRAIFLFTLLILAITTLTSCSGDKSSGPGTTFCEVNSDMVCSDNQISVPENKTVMIDKKYTIVRSDDSSLTVSAAATKLWHFFNDNDIPVKVTTDWKNNPVSDCEIIVGKTTREGDGFYTVDRELLGEGGYIIKLIGTKLLIAGGSDSATAAAVEKFIKTRSITDGAITLIDSYEFVCSPSAVLTDFTISGHSVSEYVIYTDLDNNLCAGAARYLQTELFLRVGKMLKVRPDKESNIQNGRSIIIKLTDDAMFSLSVSGDAVTISSSERTGFSRGIEDFLDGICDTVFPAASITGGYSYTHDYGKFVAYEDYGAAGDGVTDDISAIVAAHEYANINNLPVLAKEGAVYYIGGTEKTAVIKTDTDWRGASFIIDDRNVKNRSREVFNISPTKTGFNVTGVTNLKAGQENIGVTLPCDCLVTIENSNVLRYIRYGGNANDGTKQTDIIRVDKDGKVDSTTPILWDYDVITAIYARPIDAAPLTLRGGTITTIANSDDSTAYYYRGIRVYRSNVIIDGLVHTVTYEPSYGSPYYGILILNSCADVTIKNCVLTGHKTYSKIGSAGTKVSMGTYDLTVTSSVNVTIKDCRQTNDILDTAHWGVFASNYSKNLVFENCRFSRFDAHQGVANVTLRNCTFGHQGINLIGSGTALIENTTVYAKTFVNLRSDYGSTWNGALIIRGCTFIPNAGASYDAVIIGGSNPATHDFGYTCYLPQNIIIDGFHISDKNHPAEYTGPKLFANITTACTSDKFSARYPVVMTKSVSVSSLVTDTGLPLSASVNTYMFRNLKIEYK